MTTAPPLLSRKRLRLTSFGHCHPPAVLERSSCLQKGLGSTKQIHGLHAVLNMHNAHGHPATHTGYSFLAPGGQLQKGGASHFPFPGLTGSQRVICILGPTPAKAVAQPEVVGKLGIPWQEARIQVPGMPFRDHVAV